MESPLTPSRLFSTIKKIDPSTSKPVQMNSIQSNESHFENLISQLAELEQENYSLKVSNINLQRKSDSINNFSDIEKKIDKLELENLKLSEAHNFLKEVMNTQTNEKNILLKENQYLKLDIETCKKEILEKSKINENLLLENEKNKKINKKIEEQLNSANFTFLNLNKKIEALEKENNYINNQLSQMEKARDNFSLKWQMSSIKLRTDEKIREKLKETENQLHIKTQEFQQLNEKFINLSLEIRLCKESENSYKQIVEKQIKELHNKIEKSNEIKTTIESPKRKVLENENNELKNKNKSLENELKELSQQTLELTGLIKKNHIEQELNSRKMEFLANEHEKLIIQNEILKENVKEQQEINERIPSQIDQQLIESQISFVKNSKLFHEIYDQEENKEKIKNKLDCFVKFIICQGPIINEFTCLRKLYERLLVKVRNLQRENEMKNSEKKNGVINLSDILNNKNESENKNNISEYMNKETGEKMKLSDVLKEKINTKSKPKILHRSFALNKSFDLDKSSCEKYKCPKRTDKDTENIKKSSYTFKNSKSYLNNYLSKKDANKYI